MLKNPLIRILISAIILALTICIEHFTDIFTDRSTILFICYLISFLPVGLPVFAEFFDQAKKGEFFTEFSLMSLACVGAFCIGEYPEAVAVMLLYSIGEYFQDKAVDSARGKIEKLLSIRPIRATIKKGNDEEIISDPSTVEIGDIVIVRKGDRIPVDGTLNCETATFDTSAITGESYPQKIENGEEILSGSICLSEYAQIKTIRKSQDSEVERILKLVEDASARKSHTELFIRKFAKIYTPIMMLIALLIALLPLFITSLSPSAYIQKALMFLVISCPCALVISIPLSYYAGIGVASKNGILFKGGNYIDALCKIDSIYFDKTGTLTVSNNNIVARHNETLKAKEDNNIISKTTEESKFKEDTNVEQIKDDAAEAINNFYQLGIKNITILSGDKKNRVATIANNLGIENYYYELLPEDKVRLLGEKAAFVGDGINDAPVLRAATVGIAMGGAGSDAAVECADIIIQTDQPSKICTAIKIARKVEHIVKQNITIILLIKLTFLIMGLLGITSLWAAVFADSGIALIAIINSLRIIYR